MAWAGTEKGDWWSLLGVGKRFLPLFLQDLHFFILLLLIEQCTQYTLPEKCLVSTSYISCIHKSHYVHYTPVLPVARRSCRCWVAGPLGRRQMSQCQGERSQGRDQQTPGQGISQTSITRYSTVQYSTVQYSTVQYSTVHLGRALVRPASLPHTVCSIH